MQLDMAESDTASSRATFTSIDSSIQLEDDKVGNPSRKHTILNSTPCGKMNVKSMLKLVVQVGLAALYNIYLVYAMHFHRVTGRDLDWCGGLGFLIIITVIVYLTLVYYYIVKPWVRKSRIKVKLPDKMQTLLQHRVTQMCLTAFVFIGLVVFLVIDTANDRYRTVLLA